MEGTKSGLYCFWGGTIQLIFANKAMLFKLVMSMELSCCKLIINKNNGLLGSILTFTSRSSTSVFDIRRPSRQNRKRYFQRNTRISLFKGLSIFRDILKHIYFLFSLLYFLKKFSNQTKNRKYFSAFAPGVFFRTKWNCCRKKNLSTSRETIHGLNSDNKNILIFLSG